MPRRLRLNVPGVPLHIIQRGNNRGPCFFTPADRRRYLSELADLAYEFNCHVHAYVLMTNHVHLLLTPYDDDGAAPLMKRLGQRHAQYINRAYGRSGSLFEGRFRSSMVEEERYLLTCYRYIELNPVRAGLVNHPLEYPWSSYRANAAGDPDPVVIPHAVFMRIAADDARRHEDYTSLCAEALSAQALQEIREAANGGFPFGSKRFASEIASVTGRRAIRGTAGRPFRGQTPNMTILKSWSDTE